MKLFPTRSRKSAAPAHTLRRRLESLEDRSVPAALSIGSASAIEGASNLKLLDRFVAAGSGGLTRPRSLVFGPDGNNDGAQDLYVLDRDLNAVLRYDGVTGAFLNTFVASGSGGLNSPADLAFGPDGNLYVSSNFGNQVLDYSGTSGAFLSVVVSGLASPYGITFGTDGSLYIANQGTQELLRYSNSVLSAFVNASSGGLNKPQTGVFGPDGNLYVASDLTGQVLRYSGSTGTFVDSFTNTVSGQGEILWLGFGTDGYLYTTARTTPSTLNTSLNRFNAATGAYVDTQSIGRDSWSFLVGPSNTIYYSGNGGANYIERYGHSSLAAFTVSLNAASATPATVDYAAVNGTAQSGSDYVATSGTLTFAPGQTTRTILVQTLDDTLPESTETFTVNLSNPTGATIATGQGVGTIVDNEPPQVTSIVVNDGSAQRSEVRSIAVTFSGPVTFTGGANSANALPLVSLTDQSLVTRTATLSFDSLGRTVATLTFSGADTDPVSAQNGGVPSLADGRYSLTITAGLITGYAGQALDGDANGTAGGDYVSPTDTLGGGPGQLRLYRLFGDANGDGEVDQVDLSMFRRSFNASVGSPFYLSFLDADNSGSVDQLDLGQFRSRFNLNVF